MKKYKYVEKDLIAFYNRCIESKQTMNTFDSRGSREKNVGGNRYESRGSQAASCVPAGVGFGHNEGGQHHRGDGRGRGGEGTVTLIW